MKIMLNRNLPCFIFVALPFYVSESKGSAYSIFTVFGMNAPGY